MCGNLACIAALLVGIDVGWQPLPDGGLEYLIQIEPDVLETRRADEPIESFVPPQVRDVRAVRITVGTANLPRELPPPPPEPDLPAKPLPQSAYVPSPLQFDPALKPLAERPVAHVEPAPAAKAPAEPAVEKKARPEPPSKPWGTLLLCLFALFASIGLNIFLVWIAADFRRRYRALTAQVSKV